MRGRRFIAYRDWYHKVLRALMISSIIILCLIIGISYCVLFKPGPKFYATTVEGQIIALTPSN